jgi:CheY-like chemotaxis protein
MIEKSYKPLLVVEDSNEDFMVLQRLIKRMEVPNPVYRCLDGDEVLDLLNQQELNKEIQDISRPCAILLDLNLPGTDGREILQQLKNDNIFKEIPVVIFTTSSNPKDIEYCYQKGANGYLIKPMDLGELQKTVQAFVEYWLEANTTPH